MVRMTVEESYPRLSPRRYRDGEQYYDVDWNVIAPSKCILDYNVHEDHKGFYSQIYDICTGTIIARTRSYPEEAFADNAAERVMTYLREEYYFESSIEDKRI
jgi:hypothetical protein